MNSTQTASGSGLPARTQIIISSVLLVVTIGLVILLVSLRKKPAEAPARKKAPLVTTVSVRPYTNNISINLSGVAVPYREMNIAAEVSGVITEKSEECQEGRYVEAGKKLLAIDSERYQLAVDQIDSEIEEARARQEKLEVELEGAIEILELLVEDKQYQSSEEQKRKRLFDSGAISDTEYTQSRRSLIAARNAESTQRNRVESLKVDLKAQKTLVNKITIQRKTAQLDLDNATVEAPADGVIISVEVEKKEFVQVGTPVIVFEDTSRIEVRCDLRPDQLQAILDPKAAKSLEASANLDRFELPKLTATVTYRSNDRVYVWKGYLDRYDGLGLDDRTRTAPCRIVVEDTSSIQLNGKDSKGLPKGTLIGVNANATVATDELTLVRGMFLTVQLDLGPRKDLLDLPAAALRAGKIVWTVVDGKLKKNSVEVLDRYQDQAGQQRIMVRSLDNSVNVGDELIISPIPLPIENMELRIESSKDDVASTSDSSEVSKADFGRQTRLFASDKDDKAMKGRS